jgi:hypothetical protein
VLEFEAEVIAELNGVDEAAKLECPVDWNG